MGNSNRPEKVRFWRGHHDSPNRPASTDIVSGRILVDQDTGEVWLDYQDEYTLENIRRKLTDTDKFSKYGGVFEGPVILADSPEAVEKYIRDNNLDWSVDNIAATKKYVDQVDEKINTHIGNTQIHVTQEDKNYWNSKQDAVDGQGLSSNDFTDAYRKKLDDIADNATKVDYKSNYEDGASLGKIVINDKEYNIYVPKEAVSGHLAKAQAIDGLLFDGSRDVSRFALCNTKQDEANKDCRIPGFQLVNGAFVLILFSYGNTAENLTLNVSNTGKYPIVGDFTATSISLQLFVFYYNNWYVLGSTSQVVDMDIKEIISQINEINAKLATIEEGANKYVLPPATESTLGGVIIGQGVEVETDGTISVTGDSVRSALGLDEGDTILTSADFDSGEITNYIQPFVGASEDTDGEGGLVPQPFTADYNAFLKGDGTWSSVEDITDSLPNIMTYERTDTSEGIGAVVPMPAEDDTTSYLKADGSWSPIDSASNMSAITTAEIDDICK